MSTAKKRSKILSVGSIPMATAVIAALGMSTAHAQGNDTNNGQTDSLGRVAIGGTQPAWATPATEKAAVPATQTISTRIFLAGQNADQLASMAQSISEPGSANYHKYLTPAQVKSEFGATADQVKTVTDWATGAGLKVTSIGDGYVETSGPASTVQAAFGTTIANYAAPDGQSHYAPSSAAMLPAHVASVISGISGLSDTPTVNKPALATAPAAAKGAAGSAGATGTAKGSPAASAHPGSSTFVTSWCSTYWGQQSYAGIPAPICGYDGEQLRSGYGMASSGLTGKGATVAIIDAYLNPNMVSDMQTYNAQFHQQQLRQGQYTESANPAAFNNKSACGADKWNQEQALDVEAVHNMAPDANIVYVAANSCNDNDLMDAYSSVVNNHSADIVSGSIDGLMHTNGWNQDAATRAAYDRIFMRGALEGIAFNFATGDCGDNDPANAATGGNCQSDSAGKQSAWPASSQWVTAVGGTSLKVDKNGNYGGEEPWGDYLTPAGNPAHLQAGRFDGGAGGGTSTDVPQPFYQTGSVPASISQTAPNGAHLSHPMRVTPDVSMDGAPETGMAVYDAPGGNPDWSPIGGTSLATPLFAGVEALQMQAHGGVAPGFENATIYSNASKFRDITTNGNLETIYPQAYDSSGNVTTAQVAIMGQDTSLKAGPGYDTATGLGSPTLGFVQGSYDADRVGRIAGADRYQTGIQISQQQYATGSANAVVLAIGTNYPDALAGVPLAKKMGGPLLLTPGNVTDPQVVAEIHRVLKPGGKVYVLGGTAAITPKVVNGLGLPAGQVTRIGGVDRFDTALKIAGALGNPSHVVLATGNGFADALASGPYASTVFADNGNPAAILLTNDKTMNPAVAAYAHNAKAVTAVGGQAVAAATGAHLANLTKFAGFDRYDTAAQVAGTFHGEHIAGVATGLSFADALTGAAQLAQAGGPLVLTNVTNLPSYTANALHGINASLGGSGLIEIFGGPVAINMPTEYAIAAAAGAIVEG
ncbi:cell wall-binding repeat-containing protein [Catenulispora rubra]|uniref:cell wall-binding repeat-containing protein n=1 Tax=Catenulispora rubra TaxID=280293 RepID=UPI0018920CCB|nr:cell wall-binding repeat-containing protein [Catenulispora rubra]